MQSVRQAVSQSVSGQSKGRNGSAVAVVRPSVSDAAQTEMAAAAAANNKKSRWLFGREKKGWGPRAEFCLENRALGGLVVRARPKPDPKTAAKSSQASPPRLDGNDGIPSFCGKISFPISPFRGDFFWESEKGMRNPIRPSVRSFPLVQPPPRFNSSDIGPDGF